MAQRRILGLDRTTFLATVGGFSALAGVVGLIGLALLWPWFSVWLDDWMHPPFQPRITVDDAVLNGIDVHEVHAELLPTWMIAQGRRLERPEPYAASRSAVLAAVAADPNLVGLFTDLAERVETDAIDEAENISAIVGLWNEYLEEHKLPYWLDHEILIRGGEPMFYTKSYRVVETATLDVAGGPRRIRFILRVDHTNVVESYDGKVTKGEDGGYVLVDRIFDQTVTDLWPLLASTPPTDPVVAAFRESVVASMTAGVGESRLQRLRAAAEDRARLLEAVDSIGARRSCGSRFLIPVIPRLGFDRDSLATFDRYAERDVRQACPSVTPEEAESLRDTSHALLGTSGLMDDLEVLAAWNARGTAAHESQHVADALANGSPTNTPCPGCEDRLDGTAVAELSAYLTSFRGDTGPVSLLQACSVTSGPHGRALRLVFPELLPSGCEGGPPPDLDTRVQAAEQRLFGRTAPPVVRAVYPESIPLPGP